MLAHQFGVDARDGLRCFLLSCFQQRGCRCCCQAGRAVQLHDLLPAAREHMLWRGSRRRRRLQVHTKQTGLPMTS